MDPYYKVDIKRLPFRLVWSWGNLRNLLVFVVRKLLPIPFYGPQLMPGELAIHRVEEAAADRDLVELMTPPVQQLEKLGFRTAFLYTVAMLGPARSLGRALLSADQCSLCLLVASLSPVTSAVASSFLTVEESGRMIGTSSAVSRLPAVPGIDVLRLPGASAEVAAKAHLERVRTVAATRIQPEDVIAIIRRQQERMVAYYLSRGIIVPTTEEDIRRARAAG